MSSQSVAGEPAPPGTPGNIPVSGLLHAISLCAHDSPRSHRSSIDHEKPACNHVVLVPPPRFCDHAPQARLTRRLADSLTYRPPPTKCPRRSASLDTASRSFTISCTANPFSASAPVGHACTHFPHAVQFAACPQSSRRSLTSRE